MSKKEQNDLSYLDDAVKRVNHFQLLGAVSSGLNSLRAGTGRERVPILWPDDDTDKKKPDNR